MSNSAGGRGRDRLAHDAGTLRYTGPPVRSPEPLRRAWRGRKRQEKCRPMVSPILSCFTAVESKVRLRGRCS